MIRWEIIYPRWVQWIQTILNTRWQSNLLNSSTMLQYDMTHGILILLFTITFIRSSSLTPVRCGPAPLLAHAEVVWYNSSMIVHRCVDGYRSSRGGSVSVCGNAGQWQKAALKCIGERTTHGLYSMHFRSENGVGVHTKKRWGGENPYNVKLKTRLEANFSPDI